MAKARVSKYTPELVNLITAQAPLNIEKAEALAATEPFIEAGITARGIIAKSRTLGLEYEPVVRVAKDGSTIVRKNELVAAIESATGATGLDTLAKADKAALRNLLTAITGN
jgi:hypothetical protein